MEAELKARWVEALRSGEIEQGLGTLCDYTGAMCCLGVLAHIEGKLVETGNGDKGILEDDDFNVATLGRELQELYGLNVVVPVPDVFREGVFCGRISADITELEAWNCLTKFNDQKNWTFPQIADWIEAQEAF